jgi:hypothetical protein
MGIVKPYPPCVQFFAAFSKDEAALEWLWSRIEGQIASIALKSQLYPVEESDYYHKTMGKPLRKQFAVLEGWYDPAMLPTHKLLMRDWERACSMSHVSDVERPLNIDPGYMSMTKLVLASTKNREHRLYMRDGIYAEVTLAFRDQQWQPMPWTYPDYQRADFRLFFHDARRYLSKSVSMKLRDASVHPIQDSNHE